MIQKLRLPGGILEEPFVADDVTKDGGAHMGIQGRQRVIQQVNVALLVH